jgi:hypothetical protein
MYRETEDKRHWAILGMNTNKPDLYGMLRGDEALLSRFVIIHFKPIPTSFDWQIHVNKYLKDPCFGYSLKKYLEEDYEIPEDFTIDRCYGGDKKEFITNALKEHRTSADEWFDRLEFQERTVKKIPYKYILKNEIKSSYDTVVKGNNKTHNTQSLLTFLTDLGFVQINTKIDKKTEVILRIETEKYDKLMEERRGDMPCEDFDDDGDTDAY